MHNPSLRRAASPPAALASPPKRRLQLTLFVPRPWAARLDALRLRLDPVQASLIAAHVTLCREDEIERLDRWSLFSRVQQWPQGPLALSFGPPQRFQGHGLLLPCEQGGGRFQQLRQWLLLDPDARPHGAHLTLAHPRNPRAPGNTEAALASCPQGLQLQFGSVALIEQVGAEPWRLVQACSLGAQTGEARAITLLEG